MEMDTVCARAGCYSDLISALTYALLKRLKAHRFYALRGGNRSKKQCLEKARLNTDPYTRICRKQTISA